MKTLILASQSPRRVELLKKENYFFVSFPVYVSEIPNKNLSLNDQIIDIARRKALACLDQYPGSPNQAPSEVVILAADTMVCIENQALGKPADDQDAYKILSQLSGKAHQVKTSVYLIDTLTEKHISHVETTEVIFKKLRAEDIHRYLSFREHIDKAGAYGIQGHGKNLVERFSGDYENVVGLPMTALKEIFKKNDWKIKRV